jgi:hypothetical protein
MRDERLREEQGQLMSEHRRAKPEERSECAMSACAKSRADQ